MYSCLFAVHDSCSTKGSWSSVVRRPKSPAMSPKDAQTMGDEGDIGVLALDNASGYNNGTRKRNATTHQFFNGQFDNAEKYINDLFVYFFILLL